MSVADELSKLEAMRQTGALTEDEFVGAKARLLAGQSEGVAVAPASLSPAARAEQVRTWGMFLHLSLLAGYLIPFGGLVVPIVIWQLKKSELPEIDVHGKNATNWIISYIIYMVVSGLLFFVLIGIPLMIVVGVLGVVFPIIAAVKAQNGEVWKYPLSITFFK